jgi:dTDP-4-amino-4,6-dideoxygalactose transaminase
MILMNDFKAEPAELKAALLAACERVIGSGWYVLGPEVEAFERRFAAYCGAQHAVGAGNGMDAIEIVLRALDIGSGDEVITTPMTAFATVLAVLRAGAVPVLADIDPASGILSPDSVRRCIGPRTKAVVLVHLYGQLRDMAAWQALCRERGLALVEDCAQSHGARWNERGAGTFGSAGAYSFYPTKNLGALGDGGAVVTDDAALAACAARLRNYGQRERYVHPEIGLNSRLDELQAALLVVRLAWLDAFTAVRRSVAERYRDGIRHPAVTLLAPPQQPQAHVHHLFVVRCAQRDALQAHLKSRGVQSLLHYPVPVHHQQPCLDLARDPAGLAESERHARECLSLPCHPQLSDADVARVVEAVNDFAAPA